MPDRTDNNETPAPKQSRLWFGLTGSATAWMLLLIIDLILAWKMCSEQPNGFDEVTVGWIVYLMGAVTVVMFAITIYAGVMSFRDFERVSNVSIKRSEGTGREEFMALGGVFLSICMSLGILWLGLPFLVLHICTRAR